MKVLIIEDEVRAANQLQKLLKSCYVSYELLQIIDSIEESVDWLKKNQSPDLIFMDIQLADGLSFEIFHHVEVEAPIIFTTAFDQYAIQAFKVNSVDYLLKPVKQEDLNAAITKYLKSKKTQTFDPFVLKKLLSSIQSPPMRTGILVKDGNSFIQLKIDELLYAYSEDSITFGVNSSKRFIIDETIDQLFSSLDEREFYQINRGQIIARDAIVKIEPYLNHRLKLTVKNPRDQEFVVSRQRAKDLKEWMNR